MPLGLPLLTSAFYGGNLLTVMVISRIKMRGHLIFSGYLYSSRSFKLAGGNWREKASANVCVFFYILKNIFS